MNFTPEETNLINQVTEDCKLNDVTLILSPDEHITYANEEVKCNGYFYNQTRTLAVATGQPKEKWFLVFAHEHSHMEQWLADDTVWTDCCLEGKDVIEAVFKWIEGKIELDQEIVCDYIKRALNVELDCEKRTVEKIKKYNLPINVDEYIQKANSYVVFYNVIAEKRCWYIPNKEPYNIEEVWSKMPKTFDENIYGLITEKMLEIYRPCFA